MGVVHRVGVVVWGMVLLPWAHEIVTGSSTGAQEVGGSIAAISHSYGGWPVR